MREAELGRESLFGLSPPPPVRAVYSASPLLPHFHEGREVRESDFSYYYSVYSLCVDPPWKDLGLLYKNCSIVLVQIWVVLMVGFVFFFCLESFFCISSLFHPLQGLCFDMAWVFFQPFCCHCQCFTPIRF